ncbi:MAG TPA: DNA-3-methyladenine glycosylase 2 family protein [Chitinophaga sp.]|uniref:DNA-3-methyladenine glycosylase family protein n=1 Tax=Chitinophaga sp. TaxID=1869181 RepID=UPI002F91C841
MPKAKVTTAKSSTSKGSATKGATQRTAPKAAASKAVSAKAAASKAVKAKTSSAKTAAKPATIPAPPLQDANALYHPHLSKDKKLLTIMTELLPAVPVRKNIALRLIASIMSQQLSTKVATVIYNRFLALYGGKEPTPQQVLDTPAATLRSIGLSNAKVSYVHNVARFTVEEKLTDQKLQQMSNEEVLAYLTQIKGVGRWTVEMLLMFYLGREDVFAVDDLGLQQSMIKLYRLDTSDKKALRQRLLQISAKWSPYRTYASRYLWAWKDMKPVAGNEKG